MTDYRDPKVTKTSGSSGSSGAGKWIAIAIVVILALLLLAWWMGAFNGNEVDTVPVVTTEESVVDTPVTPDTEPVIVVD
ncbi:MAG TPA: hypothetical protein VGN60_00185 [Devosia sp.]|jgi:hypothetical protein|nr:hypothetical protein [Devosia sp.]